MAKKNKKGRKFNTILSVIALILVVAVGAVTTYSWIDQSTNMNLHMNEGNIKDCPENYDTYYHSINVGKDEGNESFISLNKFADLADGITLSQLSSKDGENFFYHKSGTSYKQLDANDKAVSYIAFDLDINSTCSETTKFFFDEEILRFVYGDDDSKVANSLRMSVKVTPASGTASTTIFSQKGGTYNPVTSTTGATTTVTTILDNNIYNIDKLEEGSRDFLTKINLKENSYLNSYEICKNTTIYTSEGRELQAEQSEYLEDIMPTLYSIVGKVRNIIASYGDKIRKVYITGTAALINNVDLYFQEYLDNTSCEILRPYFIQTTKDISIKDYIEVNSAISLGLMGIGEGISGMNFKNLSFSDKIPSWLKIDIGSEKSDKERKNLTEMK